MRFIKEFSNLITSIKRQETIDTFTSKFFTFLDLCIFKTPSFKYTNV